MPIGFHEIEDSIVVIRTKAVFKQTKAYERNKNVYVAAKGGFLLLRKDGRTGDPNVAWEEIEMRQNHRFDERGRMLLGR